MGLRGPKIRTVTGMRQFHVPDVKRTKNRAADLIKWIEFLPITSGFLAGKEFKLREWQKKEIRHLPLHIYVGQKPSNEDKSTVPLRTAIRRRLSTTK